MRRSLALSLGFLLLFLHGAKAHAARTSNDEPDGTSYPNVLLVVADDLGVGELASFGLGSDYAVTPYLDALAAAGVSFPNVYANPVCSPTRVGVLTGRYGFRTGIGTVVFPDGTGGTFGMPAAEETLPEMLDRGTGDAYATALFGKWHVDVISAGLLAPNNAGFEYADYRPGNLNPPEDYFRWRNVTQGVETLQVGYVPTHTVDEALAWVDQQTEPWFLYLPFNLVHFPFHKPPAGYYSEDLSGITPGPNRPTFKAMIEAMDHELGRFLTGLGLATLSNTTVIFLGDNGSPGAVIAPPWPAAQAKGTVYEGGVRVPMIVYSPLVTAPGATCDALVNQSDVFATVAELAGVDLSALYPPGFHHDSVSILPYLQDPELPSLRSYVYAEIFGPNGFNPVAYNRAIRDGRYKLWVGDPFPTEAFYDLQADPFEQNELLAVGLSPDETAAYQALKAEMMALLGPAF